ncbi:MAG: putative ABC transporter ATP-binding protein YheS [Lentisphaerae bacterium ADurb.BinA184]|nr:MAG: putative ABC transporter ATP-binding protein YheS [Lentisphaerae bacterium ADurb.BinA184]
MLDFIHVSKRFGTQDVLVDVSFRVNPGEKVGVVGPNGAGKSTLFRLVVAELSPDGGEVNRPAKQTLGYLRQQLDAWRVEDSVLEYAENAVPELRVIEHELLAIEARLAENPGPADRRDVNRLGELQATFEHLGGYDLRHRAEAALCGLGFSPAGLRSLFAEQSGGWQMRAELARVLVSRPDILLLDEPTNYLDVPAIEWLHDFLRDFPGTLLLISHDRYLLNTLTRVTLEVLGGDVTRFNGNYDHYIEERRARYEQRLAAKANQDRRREQLERFVERFRAKNTKAAQVQSKVKMLERMEEIRVPQDILPAPRIRLPAPRRAGDEVMRLDEAGVSYDGVRWVFRGLNLRIERGIKAAVVGLNGRGKTTLLRVLAGVLPPGEGRRTVGSNVDLGYQAQDITDVMDPARTVFQIAKSANPDHSDGTLRAILGAFRFSGDAIEKPVEVLSGGEKVRLALVRLLLSGPNFILLDEPTTHLDIPSRQALEEALADYPGTLCLVSHDIEFIRRVADTIFDMTPAGLVRYYGNYDYYRQKIGEPAGAPPAADAVAAPAAPTRQQERKAQKREEAQRRQEFYQRQKPFREQSEAAEQRLADLEFEQCELRERINGGELAAGDYAAISRRLADIRHESEAATAAWEEAELAIEALRTEFGMAAPGG